MPDPVPEHCVSSYVIRARFAETDLMGIVHHASYLAWFEAGRVEYLHRRGVDYLAWAEQGLHLPVLEAHVRYRRSVRFDETLIVETRLAELTRVKVRFEYRLLRRVTPASAVEPELCADGYTLLVSVDRTHTPTRLPKPAMDMLRSPETHPRPIDQV